MGFHLLGSLLPGVFVPKISFQPLRSYGMITSKRSEIGDNCLYRGGRAKSIPNQQDEKGREVKKEDLRRVKRAKTKNQILRTGRRKT